MKEENEGSFTVMENSETIRIEYSDASCAVYGYRSRCRRYQRSTRIY